MKFDKELLMMGAGAGLGVVIPAVLKKYYNVSVPFIGDYIPAPWNKTSIFIPIVAGGVVWGIAQFTKLVKDDKINNLLWMFGFTSLITGVINGAMESLPAGAAAARFRTTATARPQMARAVVNSHIVPTVQSAQVISS